MSFLLSVIAFSVVTFAFLVVERLYRSSTRPQWLDREIVAMPICVGFTAAFACSFGAVQASALILPLPIWGDVVSAIVVVVAAMLAMRALFRLISPRRLAH